MTFSVIAETLKEENTVISFDWMGHGEHVQSEDQEDEARMSQANLIDEAIEVLTFVHNKYPDRTIILVGHSMGGSIAAKTLSHLEREMAGQDIQKCILGLILIDVVEGTAMEALPFMEQIVTSRPQEFPDLASVVKYGIFNSIVKDKKSARVSMPA